MSDQRTETLDDLTDRAASIAKLDREKDPSGFAYLRLVMSQALDHDADPLRSLLREAADLADEVAALFDDDMRRYGGHVEAAVADQYAEKCRSVAARCRRVSDGETETP